MIRIQCRLPPGFAPSSSGRSPSATPRCLLVSANPSNPFRSLFLRRRSVAVSCKASSSDHPPVDGDDGEQFLEAFLLVSETLRHYNFWRQGYVEDMRWHSPGLLRHFSNWEKGPKKDVGSLGYGFLRQFQSPTIFLKIACDEDLLLPLVVGENAIHKLIDSLEDEHKECPDQYQFLKNLVGVLGYEVKMVQITKRVVNTYHANILFENRLNNRMNILSIDARPSDAIIVAKRVKAPIYVSKEIVFKDAIKILYGTWRRTGLKTIYDVSLDSAADGPDALSEELDLMRKMNLAVIEERYKDAAMWRDKLTKLQNPTDL